MSDSAWQIFDLAELASRHCDTSVEYREFLRVPTLSCGVYRLRKGSRDMQGPHDEDEVYVVLDGSARVRVGGVERRVGRGNVLYIPATEEHSFFEIDEDMSLLVMFSARGER